MLSLSTAIPQLTPTIFTSPNAQTFGNFGYSVAVSGSIVVVGAPYESSSGVEGAGNVYVVNTATGSVITLSSPNSVPYGLFGYSVALSGRTIVVGAPDENSSGVSGSGRVYLFNATTDLVAATLASPYPQTSGGFGTSVAMSGTKVVIGAPGESALGLNEAGHAYLVSLPSDRLKVLTSPNAQFGGSFGFAVSISGPTAAVSAYNENVGAYSSAGQVYTFNPSTGDAIASYASPNPQNDGFFGYSVAVSGSSLAVGAIGESGTGLDDAGHAYLFDIATDAVTALPCPEPTTYAYFGSSVAISGSRVVIGAPGENASGQLGAGSAYTYSTESGALLLGQFSSPNAQVGGSFGASVAMAGNNVVVGAYTETAGGAVQGGSAYEFTDLPLELSSENSIETGDFGQSVAVSGKLVVIGAPYEAAEGQIAAGNVYVVNTATGTVTTYSSPNAGFDGYFGFSVAISGTTILVGAPGEESTGYGSAGNAYVIDAITGEVSATLTSPNAQADGQFGTAVALSGNVAVVGAPVEGVSSVIAAGNAYTFNATSGAPIATIPNPDPTTTAFFGYSVAISGSTVVVGAPHEQVSGVDTVGAAWAFAAGTGTILATYNTPNGVVSGVFGSTVAVSGSTVYVGAPGETAVGKSLAGHVYSFNEVSGAVIRTFVDPNAQGGGEFGWAIAVSGTTLVVGAPFDTVAGFVFAGNVYLINSHTGIATERYNSADVQGSDYFGDSVAIGGSSVVVGATGENSRAGEAYLF